MTSETFHVLFLESCGQQPEGGMGGAGEGAPKWGGLVCSQTAVKKQRKSPGPSEEGWYTVYLLFKCQLPAGQLIPAVLTPFKNKNQPKEGTD